MATSGLDRWPPHQGGWSGREDLNLRPPAPKAGALPGCATPRLLRLEPSGSQRTTPLVGTYNGSNRGACRQAVGSSGWKQFAVDGSQLPVSAPSPLSLILIPRHPRQCRHRSRFEMLVLSRPASRSGRGRNGWGAVLDRECGGRLALGNCKPGGRLSAQWGCECWVGGGGGKLRTVEPRTDNRAGGGKG